MNTEIMEKPIGERVINAIESTATNFFGPHTWSTILAHIKISYRIDLKNYKTVINQPEVLEDVFCELLDSSAKFFFEEINEKLMKVFTVEKPEEFAYSRYGDFAKLINRIKNMRLIGGRFIG